jgi:hypothetical protein
MVSTAHLVHLHFNYLISILGIPNSTHSTSLLTESKVSKNPATIAVGP